MKRIRRAAKKRRGRKREERSRRRGWREEMYSRKGKSWKGRIFPGIKFGLRLPTIIEIRLTQRNFECATLKWQPQPIFCNCDDISYT